MLNKALPSSMHRGKNLIRSTIEHIKSGRKCVDKAGFLKRLTACSECELLNEGWICAKCGCFMKLKAEWAEQKCPLSKW